MPEDTLAIRQVADYLRVTERTLYRLGQGGKLPAFKVKRWNSEQSPGTEANRKAD